MTKLITSNIGRIVKNRDREHGRIWQGKIIKEVCVYDNDRVTKKKRYTKFIQVIECEKPTQLKGTQQIRFFYADRDIRQGKRPLMLSPELCARLLQKAFNAGIFKFDPQTNGIVVLPQAKSAPCECD